MRDTLLHLWIYGSLWAKAQLPQLSVHFAKIRDYVWAHRAVLARRCHDMAKQLYSNKKYAPVVWKPVSDWLYKNPDVTKMRIHRLTSFNKADEDIHKLIAECLWSFANGANLPWGRGAIQPRAYSAVPIAEKVRTSEYARG